jgi:DNA-binding IclR family transcriptional regulator
MTTLFSLAPDTADLDLAILSALAGQPAAFSLARLADLTGYSEARCEARREALIGCGRLTQDRGRWVTREPLLATGNRACLRDPRWQEALLDAETAESLQEWP